jgi:hypothetical protein
MKQQQLLYDSGGRLDCEPVLSLHRASDGFIAFARKNEKQTTGWEDLYSVRASDLRGMFPTMRQHLVDDSYFSINAMYRGDFVKSKVDSRLPAVYRCREGLRYLNACFTDLDGYKTGKTVGQLIGIVIDKQNAGAIPPISIMELSGRGVWLFWLLHRANDATLPPRAFIEKLELYHQVQRAIQDNLSELKPDAMDAARVTRVPGSVNTKAPPEQQRVRYLIPADDNGNAFTYTLGELAARFGVEQRRHHPKVQHVIDDETRGKKRHAWQELQALRLRQFLVMLSVRGKFSDGCRNRAAMLYVHFLHRNKVSPNDIDAQAEQFGRYDCHPPLRNSEIRGAIRSGKKQQTGKMSISDQTIADWLDITPGESQQLETWPAARRFGQQSSPHEPPAETTRAERQELRRKLILELVASNTDAPSFREMKMKLAEFGHSASYVTIGSDYKALDILSEESRRRRDAEELDPFDDMFSGRGG